MLPGSKNLATSTGGYPARFQKRHDMKSELESLMEPIAAKYGRVVFMMSLDYVNINRAICAGMSSMPEHAHREMHTSMHMAWCLVSIEHRVPIATFQSAVADIVRSYETIDELLAIDESARAAEFIRLPPCALGKS